MTRHSIANLKDMDSNNDNVFYFNSAKQTYWVSYLWNVSVSKGYTTDFRL